MSKNVLVALVVIFVAACGLLILVAFQKNDAEESVLASSDAQNEEGKMVKLVEDAVGGIDCSDDPCDTNADCNNTADGYQCTCRLGFTGDGISCSDLDECTSNPYTCDASAICENTAGSYECRCSPGYTGNGYSCTASACDENNDCVAYGECIASQCVCQAGFTGNGWSSCNDIDECSNTSTYTCHANATCLNQPGGYYCQCNENFTGNGLHCIHNLRGSIVNLPEGDSLDCSLYRDTVCDLYAECTRLEHGTYKCECDALASGDGLRGDNHTGCVFDATACLTDIECNDPFAVCNNASKTCMCVPGYLENSQKKCIDIDECLGNPCDENARCENTPGSFKCSCLSGYFGNGLICTFFCNVDSDCHANGRCVNSSSCACKEGFVGDGRNFCNDTDECSDATLNDCSVYATCSNTDGSFVCTCNNGYAGNGKDCVELPHTCHQILLEIGSVVNGKFPIDPDGFGPLGTMEVNCEFRNGIGITIIYTKKNFPIVMNAGNTTITYEHSYNHIQAIASKSEFCYQTVSFSCTNGGRVIDGRRFYWLDGSNNPQYSWGGAKDGLCPCGQMNKCSNPSNVCNCDGSAVNLEDLGKIVDKHKLPITGVNNGNNNGGDKLFIGEVKCGPVTFDLPRDCDDAKLAYGLKKDLAVMVDVDGPSNLGAPVLVFCNMSYDWSIGITEIPHSIVDSLIVNSSVVTLTYTVDIAIVNTLIFSSLFCSQEVEYRCRNSGLMGSTKVRWFNSLSNTAKNYFPGALGFADKCACGVTGTCEDKDVMCNCDIMDGVNRTDFGTIINKADLPVTRMQNFEVGIGRFGQVFVGNLKCSQVQFGIPPTCERIFNLGHRLTYTYLIDPDGPQIRYYTDANNQPPFPVECQMVLDPPHGVTIIHQYQENSTYMWSELTSRSIFYKVVNILQLKALKIQSTFCQQKISFKCGGLPFYTTGGSANIAWNNINGHARYYLDGTGESPPGCACSHNPNSRCESTWRKCNCDSLKNSLTDYGYIGDMGDLPITELMIRPRAFSSLSGKRGFEVTIGPMKCYNIYPTCNEIYEAVVKQKQRFVNSQYTIDPDGPGGVNPFVATCWYRRTSIRIQATYQAATLWAGPERVNACFPIQYENGITSEQVQALADRSVRCFQHLNYWCRNAPLIGHAYYENCKGEKQKGWAGSDGVDKCMCGRAGGCSGGPNAKCNCDIEDNFSRNDNGRINKKAFLPVCKVCLGSDPITPTISSRYAVFSVSSLYCSPYYPGFHDTCQKVRDHRQVTSLEAYVNYIDPDRYQGLDGEPTLCMLKPYPPIGFLEIRPKIPFYVINVTQIIITYHVVSFQHIIKTIDASKYCQQEITFDCSDALLVIEKPFGLYDRYGRWIRFWAGNNLGTTGCRNGVCNCNGVGVGKDSGFIIDKSLLPITEFRFPPSSGLRNLTVGPVKCFELYPDCNEIKLKGRDWNPMKNNSYAIDPDQEGDLEPFPAVCDFETDKTMGITEVKFPGGNELLINASSPGLHNVTVNYNSVTSVQIKKLVDISAFCYQGIQIQCTETALSVSKQQTYGFYSVNEGGLATTSFGVGYHSGRVDCACSSVGTCPANQACRCDVITNETTYDVGLITDKDSLPVTHASYWGQTSSNARAQFLLSSVRCGPKIFDFPKHCEEAYTQGYKTGEVAIRPGDGIPFFVYCDMEMIPGHGTTIIGHNIEDMVSVTNQTDVINVVYNNATTTQVNDLTKISAYCFQPMKYFCFYTKFVGKRTFYWQGYELKYRSDFGGGNSNSLQCQCGSQRKCGGYDGWWNMSRRLCNCDLETDVEWRMDAGIVNGTGDLPINRLGFENNPMARPNSRGIMQIGKLYCAQVDFDMDECEMGFNDCHKNATCINTFGSYDCECKAGFRGEGMTPTDRLTKWSNGRECYDDNECNMGLCPWSANCTNIFGSYFCTCKSGFIQTGPTTCEDIDECTHGSHNCDVNAVCINYEGGFSCRCNPGFRGSGKVGECYAYGTCLAFGDPHYLTFDGTFIHFQGQCRYILSKDGCDGRDPSFIVYTQNWDNGRDTKVLSWVKSVTVIIGATKIDMLQNYIIRLNDHNKVLPVISNGIQIKRTVRNIYVFTDFGLQVSWDGSQVVQVMIPEQYMSKTCGLCANWDKMPGNDKMVGPVSNHTYGEITDNDNIFGHSWIDANYSATHPECKDIIKTEECTLMEKSVARRWCNRIFSSSKVRECKNLMPSKQYEEFIESCVYDTCHDRKNWNIDVCNVAEAFVRTCQEEFKVVIKNWRSGDFCTKECKENEHYEDCGRVSQPPLCHNVSVTVVEDIVPCEEGCYCDDGFWLDNGKCVKPEDCGCLYQGDFHMINDKFPMNACQQMGTCLPNNTIRIDTTQCHPNASCKLKDGVHGCHCNTGYTGDGYTSCMYDPCWSNPCSGNSECIAENGDYFCKCLLGYYAECDSCYDINECETKEYKCESISECVNTEGSYRCGCPEGYVDEGPFCTDVDECDDNVLNDCGNHTKCINNRGSYTCPCCDGYSPNAAGICVESGVITGNAETKCCTCGDHKDCDDPSPVCGEDGKTYDSYKDLVVTECLEGREIGVDYKDACKSDCDDVMCESMWEECVSSTGQPKCECIPCDEQTEVQSLNEEVCSTSLIKYRTICTFLEEQCAKKINEVIVIDNNLLLCTAAPTDNVVREWNPWSPCSVTCGIGVKTRTRELRLAVRADLVSQLPLVGEAQCIEDPCPDSICANVTCTVPGAVCIDEGTTFTCVCRRCVNEGNDYVCAIVGNEQETYQNPCSVESKACFSKKPFEILNKGHCGEEPTECSKMPDLRLQVEYEGQNCTLKYPLNFGRCAGGCGVIQSELCCEPIARETKSVEMFCPNSGKSEQDFSVISACNCSTAALPEA